jgi:C_GCAxxG_C_C family probable redox protein
MQLCSATQVRDCLGIPVYENQQSICSVLPHSIMGRRYNQMDTAFPQEVMDSRIAKKVTETLNRSKNCAQTSFAVLQDEFNLNGGAILKALTPFPGIALRGETCGAVIGCLMALGMVYGRDNLDDWKAYLASLPPARRFCRRFEEANGSIACSAILEIKLGRSYDLANRVDALKYAVAGGQKTCGKVIESAVKIAAEIIMKKS